MICLNKNNIAETQCNLNESGYGYDELKDFDMGYRGRPKSKITPFRGQLR